MEAIEAFLAHDRPSSRSTREREKFLITFNPAATCAGWR